MNGGRAGASGLRIWQKPGLRKSRARRAPCLWQGAADLMAFGLLPPAPKNLAGKWGLGGSVGGVFGGLGGSLGRFLSLKGGTWRLEAGKWRLEAGKWRLKTGKWRQEGGKWRLEAGKWRLETGKWRLEAGKGETVKSDVLLNEN